MAPDERREAIIDAVIPLLVSHGASVTTRQIAEAAGVAEGTIFRVFPDKCALMHAAAHATMDPAAGRRELGKIDPALDLEGTARVVAAYLLERMDTVMAVMMAVRGLPQADVPRPPGREGPPEFVIEANRALLDVLTEVFERHHEELRVRPERAALIVRSLVFGSRHPGMADPPTLTADEIAAVLVSGIAQARRAG